MTTIFKKLNLLTLVLAMVMSITSCKKDKYDNPDNIYPELAAGSITIADLKAMFSSGAPITIEDDIDITGIVIADDRSGNLYQQFIIDDGTAAIPVLVDRNGIYAEFPVGRKVNIKCKGLVLGSYAGNKQLGGYADGISVEPLASNLVSTHITGGTLNNDITGLIQNITAFSQLNSSLISRLIKIEHVEFEESDVDQTWAQLNAQGLYVDGERYIYTCSNTSSSVMIRTSEFSDFALSKTPAGNGTVTALYTVFNSTKQLVIRDLTDVAITDTLRCEDLYPVLLSEDFETTPGSGNISLPNWVTISSAGTKSWYSSGTTNKNARFSAFSSNASFQETSNIGWLITPPLNMNTYTNEALTFRRSLGFVTGTIKMEVLYSSDYTGSGDPTVATWTLLVDDAPLATTSYATSNPVSLNSVTGTNVYFAFRYTGGYGASGTGDDATTQYNLDNIVISVQP